MNQHRAIRFAAACGVASLGKAIRRRAHTCSLITAQNTLECISPLAFSSRHSTPPQHYKPPHRSSLNGPLVAGGDVSNYGLHFSPDGSRILYLANQDTDGPYELFSVPSAGGTPIKLDGPRVAGGSVSTSVRYSPDGSRVIYQADQDTDGVFELFSK